MNIMKIFLLILNYHWVYIKLIIFSYLIKKKKTFSDNVFLNSLDHPSLDIRINQGNFSWNSADDISLKDIDLTIARGSLVLILGRVGSGKTTLLNSLLGELNKINGTINVHRVLENGFAYVRLIELLILNFFLFNFF